MSHAIAISRLTLAHQNAALLLTADGHIPHGTCTALIGPNGCGKTTLLKSLIGLHTPTNGGIEILGGTYDAMRLKVAYMPQRSSVDWNFPATVFDVALMGRYGLLGWFKRPNKLDKEKALHALSLVGLADYTHRSIKHLSGGQQQRLFLARALAQEPELYLLDEPLAGIDAHSEKLIMQVLHHLRSEGKTIVMVHHDLHTLKHYFDWTVCMHHKKLICAPTETIVSPALIKDVYGLNLW